MPINTPRGYTVPTYGDTQNFPAQMQTYALDVDADVQLLEDRIQDALNRPSVRLVGIGNVAVAANTNVTMTFTSEEYDNNAMADIAVNNQIITLNEPGIYLITAAITFLTNGNATAFAAMTTLVSSLGVVPIPGRKAVRGTQNFNTTVHVAALHQALAPDNITLQARHNSAASVNINARHLAATKVSGILGGF